MGVALGRCLLCWLALYPALSQLEGPASPAQDPLPCVLLASAVARAMVSGVLVRPAQPEPTTDSVNLWGCLPSSVGRALWRGEPSLRLLAAIANQLFLSSDAGNYGCAWTSQGVTAYWAGPGPSSASGTSVSLSQPAEESACL